MLKTGNRKAHTRQPNRSLWSLFPALFNRRWRWTTLLVVLGMLVMARLGMWQLDRLEQRRARNAATAHQLSLAPLPLTGNPLPGQPVDLKHRLATAGGQFDYSRQIVLKLQNWTGPTAPDSLGAPVEAVGVELITPLVIEGTSTAVLVNRGWIPDAQANPDAIAGFNTPAGTVTVTGRVMLSEALAGERGDSAPPGTPQAEWYRVDIEAIQAQMPYRLLPVYIQQIPADGVPAALPFKTDLQFDLSEGPHMGYAIQWFAFALLLGGGYLYYVNKNGN
ncbi:MAG: SURF1 family protein [Anaerolineae bacterium]